MDGEELLTASYCPGCSVHDKLPKVQPVLVVDLCKMSTEYYYKITYCMHPESLRLDGWDEIARIGLREGQAMTLLMQWGTL